MPGASLKPRRVYSWNVNGLRACAKKGFLTWLEQSRGHLVCVQEVRARREQLEPSLRDPAGWRSDFSSAVRKGYSGVGYFCRQPVDDYECCLGEQRFDCEGRVQMFRVGKLRVANIYFPNGSGPGRDHSRVPYKLDFYRALFERLAPDFHAGVPWLVVGDFNTAHNEWDLARPKQNHKTSGFLPAERGEFSRWVEAGWVDTFRACQPPELARRDGFYTWWSQRVGVRERNVGWRIDYMLASPGLASHVRAANIHPDVLGSDHCPISVDLDPELFETERLE